MSKETTTPASTTWPHQDFIKDNSVVLTELPAKTQELISKFSSLTDKDAQEAMDEKIYGQIDDHLEKKAEEAKKAKTKEKINEQKKKKAGLDVSAAATAKTPEQEEAEKKAAEGEKKPRTVFDRIYGRS